MPVDTRGLSQTNIGKRLRIESIHGAVEEIDFLELTVCEKPQPCCAITYRLVSSNQEDCCKAEGSLYWIGFNNIKSSAMLGEGLA